FPPGCRRKRVRHENMGHETRQKRKYSLLSHLLSRVLCLIRGRSAMIFRDRIDAGRRLAEKLEHYVGRPDVIVLALPRGGVPVGYEVAPALGAPLDVFLVRKLGVPGREERAMGAIASGGVRVLNEDVVSELGIPQHWVDIVAAREMEELRRREAAYRDGRPAPDVRGKSVILVDDGLATGASMRAAVAALRKL